MDPLEASGERSRGAPRLARRASAVGGRSHRPGRGRRRRMRPRELPVAVPALPRLGHARVARAAHASTPFSRTPIHRGRMTRAAPDRRPSMPAPSPRLVPIAAAGACQPSRPRSRLSQRLEGIEHMRTVLSVLIGAIAAASAIGAAAPAERVAATPIPEAATAIRIDGELNDAVWQTAPAITGFRQRDPNDGAPPTFETEARIAYDATALYIAVQALDPEPERIVGHPHAARRRIAVGLDARDRRLVSRSPIRLRVRGQPGRRQAGRVLVQRRQQRSGLGRGVGRRRVARRARLARRVPHSVLAAALPARPTTATFGLASSGRSAG